MNIQDVRLVSNVLTNLKPICKALHRLDENSCNYGLTEQQEKRQIRLENKAEEFAKDLGLHFYHQTDPRGGTGYLIDDSMNDTNYHNGVYIN